MNQRATIHVGGSARGRPRRRFSCGPRSESPPTRKWAARFDYKVNSLPRASQESGAARRARRGSVQSLPEKSVSFAPLGHSLSGGFFFRASVAKSAPGLAGRSQGTSVSLAIARAKQCIIVPKDVFSNRGPLLHGNHKEPWDAADTNVCACRRCGLLPGNSHRGPSSRHGKRTDRKQGGRGFPADAPGCPASGTAPRDSAPWSAKRRRTGRRPAA